MSLKQTVPLLSALFVGCALLPVSSFAQAFQPSQPVQLASGATITFHADFNNDGREDLVVTATSNNGAVDQLYLSNGDGTYKTPVALPALVQAIGDFNHDGKLDFASIGPAGGDISVYLGNGDGTFQAPKITTGPNTGFATLVSVDLNHDSKTDLVGAYFGDGASSPATLQLWISNGDGTLTKGQTIVAGTGSLAHQAATNVLTGDFDGDGKADIALLYGITYDSATAKNLTEPTSVQVFYGDGAGHLGSPSVTADPSKYSDNAAVAADVNNDGRSDIVSVPSTITNNGTGSQPVALLSIFTGNSNRTLGHTTTATNQCAGILGEGITVADFNADGLNDIAYPESACNQSNYNTNLAIKLGAGAGKFQAEQVVYQNLYQTGAPFAIKSTTGTDPDLVFSEYLGGSKGAIELLTNTTPAPFPGCPMPFAEGVNACQPGSVATQPVTFHLAAAGPTPMRAVQVWADGKKVAEQLTNAFSNYSFFDGSVPLTTGKHAITLFGTGWDGTLQKKSYTVTVDRNQSCYSPSSPGVHLCQPANGATVSSPVIIQASTTVSGKFARIEVWIDGVKKFTETDTNGLYTTLAVPAGTHRFAVLVYNTAGSKWEQAVNATVK